MGVADAAIGGACARGEEMDLETVQRRKLPSFESAAMTTTLCSNSDPLGL